LRQVRELRANLAILQRQLQLERAERRAIEQQAAHCTAQRDEVLSRAEVMEQRLHRQAEQQTDLIYLSERHELEAERLREENQALDARSESLRLRFDALGHRVEQLEQDNEALSASIKASFEQREKRTAELAEKDAQQRAMLHETRQLRTQLEDERAAGNRNQRFLESTNEALRVELSSAQADLGRTLQELRTARSDHANVVNELERQARQLRSHAAHSTDQISPPAFGGSTADFRAKLSGATNRTEECVSHWHDTVSTELRRQARGPPLKEPRPRSGT
jgi:chromosome segregation ATPase